MEFLKNIQNYADYLEIIMIFIGYLAVSLTILMRLPGLNKLAGGILKFFGIYEKISKYLSYLPTLGINPMTAKLKKEMDEARAKLAEVYDVPPTDKEQ